jgi:hypothetical protein
VILGAYTVYADIVLCDLEGRVLANGFPEKHRFTRNLGHAEMFRAAMNTASGEEYGFQAYTRMEEIHGHHVLVYSCTVREGGDQNGAVIGVIGIIFKWDSLGQTVVQNTPISQDEKSSTRCLVIDSQGLCWPILPAYHSGQADFPGTIPLHSGRGEAVQPGLAEWQVLSGCCMRSPRGFETYSTGWHSVVLQELRQA